MAHQLGHVLMGEHDARIGCCGGWSSTPANTARYNVYYGEGRDAYDVRGRTAHEAIFNVNDGRFRCPSTQQGYSPFSTWTRGLAWAMLGFAEQLEFLATVADDDLEPYGGRGRGTRRCCEAAEATCDFYLEHTPTDGMPYWDTGAPGPGRSSATTSAAPADPFNAHEPVDSSAAAIARAGPAAAGPLPGRHAARAAVLAGRADRAATRCSTSRT